MRASGTPLVVCFLFTAGCAGDPSGAASAVDPSLTDAGRAGSGGGAIAAAAGGRTQGAGGAGANGGQSSSGGVTTGQGGAANEPDGAAAGAGGSGSPDAGTRVVVCPTAPPYDELDTELVAQCTKPVAVGVGNALRRLTTFDGHAWQYEAAFPDAGQDQNENSHRDVAIANGVVVITGDGGVLASRDAGTTYEKVIDVRNHDSAIAVFHGAFWIVGTQLTARSTDGFTWQKWSGATPVPGGLPGGWDASALAASPGRLVAVTGRHNARRVFDGTTWTESTFGAGYGTLSALAYGGGHFVLLGYACCDQDPFAGLRATSAAGDAWTLETNASSASSFRFGDLLWDGARFVATASQYDRRVFFSTDGLTYDAQTSTTGIGAVARLGTQYLGTNDGVLFTSADAKGWTEAYRAADGKRWGLTRIRTGTVLK